MSQRIKMTTPGEWIVTTTDDDEIKVVAVNEHRSIQKDIAITGSLDNTGEEEALANAALIATAKDMLDAIIEIQIELNTAQVIDIEKINEIISNVFAKLANEAGEEL